MGLWLVCLPSPNWKVCVCVQTMNKMYHKSIKNFYWAVTYGVVWYFMVHGYCTYLVDKCPYLDDQVDKCTSVAGNKGGSCKDSFIILHF